MNKYLFILTFFILTSKIGISQTNIYHPLPDSNAIWNESIWYMDYPCIVTDSYSLFINGDTSINTNIYHKIYKSGYISATCPPPGNYYSNDYTGALRQDIEQKKIYFIQKSTFTEQLLYDFNISIGDTLPQSYNFGSGNIVIGIDSVIVGNNNRKRFLLTPFGGSGQIDSTYAIIEGIGSTFGLLNPIAPPFESGSQFYCFGNNGEFYPPTSNCIVNVETIKTDNEKCEIEIFPNPFSIETTVKTNGIFKYANLIIYNSIGQKVNEIKNITGQTFVLQQKNLSSGLYFIYMSQDNKNIVRNKMFIIE